MDDPLIDGKTLADALGVSGAAVSVAVREERPCQGRPVHRWADRDKKGTVRGYAVPRPVRIELALPPYEGLLPEGASSEGEASEDSSPEKPSEALVREATRWYVTKVAAQVAWSIREEMGPWLREAIRARIEAGEWPPAWASEEESSPDPEKEGPPETKEEAPEIDIIGPLLRADFFEGSPEESASGDDGQK